MFGVKKTLRIIMRRMLLKEHSTERRMEVKKDHGGP